MNLVQCDVFTLCSGICEQWALHDTAAEGLWRGGNMWGEGCGENVLRRRLLGEGCGESVVRRMLLGGGSCENDVGRQLLPG